MGISEHPNPGFRKLHPGYSKFRISLMTNWHRLFGLFLMDLFSESSYVVELENDLSLKQQFLDVVILRKDRNRKLPVLPDGLDDLADHNFPSYKSLNEAFDDWALKELTGHYVNCRKQISPHWNRLLPEDSFRLYGIATRFPRKLLLVPLKQLKAGVYETRRGTDSIRMIVLSEIAASRAASRIGRDLQENLFVIDAARGWLGKCLGVGHAQNRREQF